MVYRVRFVFAVLFCTMSIVPAFAILVPQGLDMWTTSSAAWNFTSGPIPADFFDPGSDPFIGTVQLGGEPLGTSPLCPLATMGQVDTIVQRLSDAALPLDGSQTTVPIELVALNLVSVAPITVTYGASTEQWDVRMSLSQTQPSQGGMQIMRQSAEGGTFSASIQVQPLFTFTRVSDSVERVLDGPLFTIHDTISTGCFWRLDPPPGFICPNCSEQGHAGLDANGLVPFPANGGRSQFGWQSACIPGTPLEIGPGAMLMRISEQSQWDFVDTPIPADFFEPGSDPFTGMIQLGGEPVIQRDDQCPGSTLGATDTIVKRTGTASLPGDGSTDVVPIELVALSLVSVQPITVTYNGGQNPTPWNVNVTLSPIQPSTGNMTITRANPSSGTFTSDLIVVPRFVFTKVNSTGGEQAVLDAGDLSAFAQALETCDPSQWQTHQPDINCDGPVGLSDITPFVTHFSADCGNKTASTAFSFAPTDFSIDSDGDGLTDGDEADLGTNPFDADSDDDGLSDAEEVNDQGTDPLDDDTDNDGFTDGFEVEIGSDPNNALVSVPMSFTGAIAIVGLLSLWGLSYIRASRKQRS